MFTTIVPYKKEKYINLSFDWNEKEYQECGNGKKRKKRKSFSYKDAILHNHNSQPSFSLIAL